MIRSRLCFPVAVVALFVIVLSGCGLTEEISTGPTASPSANVPSPTPELIRPTLGEIVFSENGLGSLVVGQAPRVVSADTDILIFEPELCAGYVPAEGAWPVEPGAWVAAYPDTLSPLWGTPLPPFQVGVLDSVIYRVDVQSPEIVTDRGIHLGSTIDEVRAVYGAALSEEYLRGPSAVVAVVGSQSQLFIEYAYAEAGQPSSWEPAQVGKVISLRLEPLNRALYGISHSDNTLPRCYEIPQS